MSDVSYFIYGLIMAILGWATFLTKKVFILDKDKVTSVEVEDMLDQKMEIAKEKQASLKEDMQEIKEDINRLQDKLEKILDLHSKP